MTQQKKRIGITIPGHLHQKIVEEAEYWGVTINALISLILREWIETNEKEEQDV